MPFGMVSGVSRGMGVLDGGPPSQEERGGIWGLMSVCFYGICVADREMYSVCVRTFDKISVWPIDCWKRLFVGFLKMYSISRLGFMRNLLKCNSDFNFVFCKQQTAAANCSVDFFR